VCFLRGISSDCCRADSVLGDAVAAHASLSPQWKFDASLTGVTEEEWPIRRTSFAARARRT
jgi:hypothetical protein